MEPMAGRTGTATAIACCAVTGEFPTSFSPDISAAVFMELERNVRRTLDDRRIICGTVDKPFNVIRERNARQADVFVDHEEGEDAWRSP